MSFCLKKGLILYHCHYLSFTVLEPFYSLPFGKGWG